MCTPPAIWASFQAVYRDGSEDWIDSYLSQTEQRGDLTARLRSGQASAAAAEHWEEKLPPAAAIVWQTLTGKRSAIAAADATRLLELKEDRTAVLTTLTLMAHAPAPPAAMIWTLSLPREQTITLGWMLSAGNPKARDWAVNLLLQCTRDCLTLGLGPVPTLCPAASRQCCTACPA